MRTDADDLLAIARLQARYGDVVTRRAWDELPALFRPDARVEIDTRTSAPLVLVGGAAVAAFVEPAIERFDLFVFTIVNAVCDLEGPDEASGRVYICEVRQDRASGRHSQAYGLYRDRYARDADRWAFAERRYSSLGRTGPDFEVFGLPQGRGV